MNCTKCGKEITEEGKTICDECQKELLKEIKVEENASNDEAFKVSKDEKKKKGSPIVFIIALLLIALIVVGVYLFMEMMNNTGIGNEIGNIRNYGYAVKQNNTIYYLAPNDTSTKVGIFSVDANGDNKKEIYMNENDILSLNVYGNYLYFISVTASENEEEYDNKICRIKKDGTGFEIINDNEFNDFCYEIYAVQNKIYYIGEDSNIYKMDLNGGNRELVSDVGTGYIGITEKYIIYNDNKENASEGEDQYKTCIMNLDGTNKRDIIENKRLYTVNILNDVIYYTDENLDLYKVNLDGSDNQKILDGEVYKLIVSGNYLYYLNYADIANNDQTICIYRANLDGSDNKIIKKLDTGTSFINVVGDWVLYMDSTLESGYIRIIKNDGSEEKDLYSINFMDLYNQIDNTTVDEDYITEEDSNEILNEINDAIASNEILGNEVTTESSNVSNQNTVTNSASNTANNVNVSAVNSTSTSSTNTTQTNTTAQNQNVTNTQ